MESKGSRSNEIKLRADPQAQTLVPVCSKLRDGGRDSKVRQNKQWLRHDILPEEKPEGGDVVQSMRVGEECMKATQAPLNPLPQCGVASRLTPAQVACPAKTCLW
jgi:hypothetical protein